MNNFVKRIKIPNFEKNLYVDGKSLCQRKHDSKAEHINKDPSNA